MERGKSWYYLSLGCQVITLDVFNLEASRVPSDLTLTAENGGFLHLSSPPRAFFPSRFYWQNALKPSAWVNNYCQQCSAVHDCHLKQVLEIHSKNNANCKCTLGGDCCKNIMQVGQMGSERCLIPGSVI